LNAICIQEKREAPPPQLQRAFLSFAPRRSPRAPIIRASAAPRAAGDPAQSLGVEQSPRIRPLANRNFLGKNQKKVG